MLMKNRVEKVVQKMKQLEISQMLITDPLSIYYLTGKYIDPGERFYALYLRADGNNLYFVNRLFTVEEDLGVEKVWYSDTDHVMDLVASRMDTKSVLGVDKDLPSRFLLPLIEKKAGSGFQNASVTVDETRGCKDSEEQLKMKVVSKINDLAMAEFKKLIQPGATELGMALKMLDIYRNLGAEDYSFEPLVAFGPNCAEGHHSPDHTVLKEGDSVLIDVGCKKDNYCSDMTRTFLYGTCSEEHRKVYETVKNANQMAIAGIRPGMKLKDIDAIARNIISDAGYGPFFTHRLGHFIGLNVHEFGDVSAANEKEAEAGMIFSIEPGIYLPGDVGVRIEDLVVVTENGCERLNFYNKELEIVK